MQDVLEKMIILGLETDNLDLPPDLGCKIPRGDL